MKRAPVILLCIVGLLGGVLTGRMLPRAASKQTTTAKASPTTTSTPHGHDGPAKPAKEQKHDLPTLLKKWNENSDFSRNPVVERELERMSAPALRELIGQMMSIFGNGENSPDTFAARELIVSASRELYRRDGESALEWATTAKGDRELILSWMLNEAAIDSPDLAKRWIDRMKNAEGFHEGWWQSTVYFALAGASSRGADDLIRFNESYAGLIPGRSLTPASFPPGFEYGKLFTSLGTKAPLNDMMQYWSATDRDAAWNSVKDLIDTHAKGAGYAGDLFAGAAAVQGGENAAKWLLPKLEQLPEAMRTEAIESLPRGLLSPESISFVMAGISRESDRITLAKPYVNIGTNGGQDLAALRGLSSDTSRSTVLIAAASSVAPAIPNAEPRHAKAIRDYFLKTMESLDLPKDAQAEVMEVLETPAK